MKNANKLLVALLKEPNDLKILVNQGWYRIPFGKKSTPLMIRDKSAKYIAFYQGKSFKSDAFQVKYFAKISKIEVKTRRELFPDEVENPKSENLYFKISIQKLKELQAPIISTKKRIIIFINSNFEKFSEAMEINDLYLGSKIEEIMWAKLNEIEIPAEREFHQKIQNKNYFIDFAVFCKKTKLALECDGDKYHLKEDDVKYDKRRDNALESKGWNVLRYTSDEINYNLDNIALQIQETINEYGGIKLKNEVKYYPFHKDKTQQHLFES